MYVSFLVHQANEITILFNPVKNFVNCCEIKIVCLYVTANCNLIKTLLVYLIQRIFNFIYIRKTL